MSTNLGEIKTRTAVVNHKPKISFCLTCSEQHCSPKGVPGSLRFRIPDKLTSQASCPCLLMIKIRIDVVDTFIGSNIVLGRPALYIPSKRLLFWCLVTKLDIQEGRSHISIGATSGCAARFNPYDKTGGQEEFFFPKSNRGDTIFYIFKGNCIGDHGPNYPVIRAFKAVICMIIKN